MGQDGSKAADDGFFSNGSSSGGDKLVLRKYLMDMSEDGLMGKGSFSTCRRGRAKDTGEDVAIKFFTVAKIDKTHLTKFTRQIDVLQMLQRPFSKPQDPRLWSPQLEKAKPARLFMRLIDYSRDHGGKPGLDSKDNILLVVTEPGQYSLKDYLSIRKREDEPPSRDTVKSVTKALLLVMAGLHAKGLVHLDMKPENLMVFDGCLKLIDVDGCVKIGSAISMDDPSISFSPCYCAPEWAKFLVDPEDDKSTIAAAAPLDVWSVGCTICELVTLEAIMKPVYCNMLRSARNHREASFNFLEWLSCNKKTPVPNDVGAFDRQLASMLTNSICVADVRNRKSCAECLQDAYLRDESLHATKDNPLSHTAFEELDTLKLPSEGAHQRRHRTEDHSSAAMFHGPLWKLNSGGDVHDPMQWLERDMWIANNGSLCYYSQAEDKRLVLLDAHHLYGAKLVEFKGGARPYAFQVHTIHLEKPGDSSEPETFTFAGVSAADTAKWLQFLRVSSRMDAMPTMKLGKSVAQALNAFKMTVKNRRQKVAVGEEQHYEAVFRGVLWKVKADGDRMNPTHWFKREMWLARNGSLVYWSARDNRELIYYTAEDLRRANLVKLPQEQSAKPFTFQVCLPAHDGMEFSPGEFSAESEEMRTRWIKEITKLKAASVQNKESSGSSCFAWCK